MGLKNRLITAFCTPSYTEVIPPRRERILVVSTTGLGDTLWATPALRALRSSFPNSFLALLTTPMGAHLLAGAPYLDQIYTLRQPIAFTLPWLYARLRWKQFDTILLFHASQRVVYPLCALLKPADWIASEDNHKGLERLLRLVMPLRGLHEIERRLELVEAIGGSWDSPLLDVPLTAGEKEKGVALVESYRQFPNQPVVVLHPGAADLFKQWPPSYFSALGQRLEHHLGCRVLVTGGKEELDLAIEVAAEIPGAVSLAGKLSVRELAAFFAAVSLVIIGDTGPMHIASAVHVPTVALFCPTDPKLSGPHLAPRVRVLRKRRSCTPCLRKNCQDPFCMRQLSVDEVYDAALTLFYTGRPA